MGENVEIQGILLEKTEKYRIDTEEMVIKFVEQVKAKSFKEGYELVSYASTKKEKKSKGEVEAEDSIVTITKKL